ncbi:Nuclear transport factor 2, eukaryote,NTF2-like domain [Cinara cedri]|uniref:Nuclear transport factor 2, eukaryote,NTF2-like domain n=1 Tax=Cinara cedri TaxID=506608 RepID=A0A5E4NJ00_9HEMI|nr:Nuclear transport factor 2, eukaryote,NTF2-like domain [Cinara cedri]
MTYPLTLSKNAAYVGQKFIERYYDVLSSNPENAYQFYDKLGEYQTVHEDGKVVVARTWQEINSVLLNPTFANKLVVNSITSVPCGRSLDHLMITATGKQFTHVYFVEFRSELQLSYAIMASIYLRTESASDKPPKPVTTSAAPDYPIEKAANQKSTTILKVKKRVHFSDNIATYYEPSLGNVVDSTTKGQPIKLLECSPTRTKILSSKKSSPNTVTDNTRSNVDTKCSPKGILSSVPTSVEVASSHVPSVNTGTKNIQSIFAANYSPIRIIDSVPAPAEIESFRNPSPNNVKNQISSTAIRRKRKVREDGYYSVSTPNFQIFSTMSCPSSIIDPDKASRSTKKRPRNRIIEFL